MKIKPNIFREYDIRGIVGTELREEDAFAIARAFGTYMREHGNSVVSLGRDVRLTSDRFGEIAREGLTSTGCEVLDIGTVPTPLLYFSLYNLPVEGGMMITASHNPSEYNGFKLCLGTSSVYGKEIQKIRELVESDKFATGKASVTEVPNIITR